MTLRDAYTDADTIDRMRRENESLRADAERYRWLRDDTDPDAEQPYAIKHETNSWGQWVNIWQYGASLDAAIDSARKAPHTKE
jgi:hypothetical protein